MQRNFASSPKDALQCLVDLIETTKKIRKDVSIHKTIKGTTLGFVVEEKDTWDRMLRPGLPVYYWTHKTASLVLQASHGYPLDTTETVDLPEIVNRFKAGEKVPPPTFMPKVPRGFAVFDKPLLFIDVNGNQHPISALMWELVFWKTSEIPIRMSLAIRGIEWIGTVACPCFWADFALGDPQEKNLQILTTDPNHTFKKEQAIFTKWICTASTFIEQNILSVSANIVGKATARRLPPDFEPICHVITLRKTIHDHVEGEESFVEWSHRWLVRGHWRQQYFPSSNTHAPVWISPYVKGPEDKPFKTPLPTVYAVTK